MASARVGNSNEVPHLPDSAISTSFLFLFPCSLIWAIFVLVVHSASNINLSLMRMLLPGWQIQSSFNEIEDRQHY